MEAPEQSASEFQYFKGYPAQYRSTRFLELGCAVVTVTPFLAVTVSDASLYALIWFRVGLTFAASLSLLGLLAMGYGFGYLLRNGIYAALHPRIVPCFQQRLGDINTFQSGREIAKHCQALDEAAIRLGLTPLSAFGFGDSFFGGKPTWHPAEDGLMTVVHLLQYVCESEEASFPNRAKLFRELSAVEEALQKAASRGIMFCLHLKTETGTSLLIEQRHGGSCF